MSAAPAGMTVGGNETCTVHKDRTRTVKEGDETVALEEGRRSVTIALGDDTLGIDSGSRQVKVPVGENAVSAKDIKLTASDSIEIVCGGGPIKMTAAGAITINGVNLKSIAAAVNDIKGALVKIDT